MGIISRFLGITTMKDLLRESAKFQDELKNSVEFCIYSRDKIAYLETKLIHVNKLKERYKSYIVLDQEDLEELYEFKSDLDSKLEELAEGLSEEEKDYVGRSDIGGLQDINKTLENLKTLEEIAREDITKILRLIKVFVEIEIKRSLDYI